MKIRIRKDLHKDREQNEERTLLVWLEQDIDTEAVLVAAVAGERLSQRYLLTLTDSGIYLHGPVDDLGIEVSRSGRLKVTSDP